MCRCRWERAGRIDLYEVQWRVVSAYDSELLVPPGVAQPWTTSEAARQLQGVCCVKAGLAPGHAYEFRVAPSSMAHPPPREPYEFSEPSEPILVAHPGGNGGGGSAPVRAAGGGAEAGGASPSATPAAAALPSVLELQRANADLRRANEELTRSLDEERRISQQMRAANAELQEQVMRLVAVVTNTTTAVAANAFGPPPPPKATRVVEVEPQPQPSGHAPDTPPADAVAEDQMLFRL